MSIGIDIIDNIEEVLETGKSIRVADIGQNEYVVKAIKTDDKYRMIFVEDGASLFVNRDTKEDILFDDIEELLCMLAIFEFEEVQVIE
ncbi:MAG: hypothetical protein ACRDB0_06130 [Paraclostridium sp.]